MEKRRGSEFIAIIGNNNTGKTVVAKQLIERFNRRRDKLESVKKYPSNYNKLIVYDPQHRFADVMRKGDYEIQLDDENWEARVLKYRASLLIMDDYKELFLNDTMTPRFIGVLSARARYGLDIIIITWHPRYILPKLTPL